MSYRLTFALGLLAVLVAGGCAPGIIYDDGGVPRANFECVAAGACAQLVTLNRGDMDLMLPLGMDEVARVELPANLSTGYRWEMDEFESSNLQVLGSDYIQQGKGLLGEGGTMRFFVAAKSGGVGALQLTHLSPATGEAIEQATYHFDLEGPFSGDFQLPPPEDQFEPLPEPGLRDTGLPTHFNWCEQNGCTPVRNQGYCGSCWAFATVGPLESAIRIKDGVEQNLAEQYLVSCNSEGWGCNGGWWGHDYHEWKMVNGETEAGSPLDSVFPYQASDVACNPPHAKAHRIVNWEYVTSFGGVPSVDQLKEAIFNHGPVSVAVCVNSAFQAYSSGVFTGPSCVSVNHGVTLVGWDEGGGYWYLKNSWGPGWGESGYMRIKYGVSQIGHSAAYVEYTGGSLYADFTFSSVGNLTVNFTDVSVAPTGGTIQSRQWSFGDGGTSAEQNPTHVYAAEGTYSVSLTVTDSNANSSTRTKTVPASLQPVYCVSKSGSCGEEWISQVTIGAFTHSSGAQNFSDFTDQIVALNPGTHAVALTPQFNGGPWEEFFRIWIDLNGNGSLADPGEEVFAASGQSAVSGSLIIPATAAPGNRRMRISMKYDSAPSPCESFNYGEVEDYTANIGGGGGGSPPVAAFAFSVGGLVAQFTDQSTDPDSDITARQWSFGDGASSPEQNPAHAYAVAGTYSVSLTVTDSGARSSTVTKDVTVSPPSPAYCASKSQHCNEEWIAQVSIGGFAYASGAQNYSDFTGQIVALSPGNHAVTLTPQFNGGPWIEHFRIWIDFNGNQDFNDAGEVVFTSSGQAAVSGTLTIPAAATPGSRRMRISMKYNSAPGPCETFSYGEVEDYTVTIGGGGSPPVAGFAFSVNGLVVQFTDQSTDPDGDITSRQWDFGDGSTSPEQSPIHTFSATGTFTVSLTVTDSAAQSNTASKQVTLSPPAPVYCESRSQHCNEEWIALVSVGDFSNPSGSQNYSDFTGQVIALPPGTYPVTITPQFLTRPFTEHFRVWIDLNGNGDFTDPGDEVFAASGQAAVSGSLIVPASAAPGMRRMRISMKYNVPPGPCELLDYGEVEDYTVNIGEGGSPPTASFGYSPSGLTVQFADQSTDPDSDITVRQWNFGDGGSSQEPNPNHAYATAGSYAVTLTVIDASSFSSQATQTVTVQETPTPAFCQSKSRFCNSVWVGEVSIDGFSNPSGDQFYSDFASTVFPLDPGTHVVSVTPQLYSATSQPQYSRAWIDFNANGVFTDPGEEILAMSGQTTVSAAFDIPPAALPGLRRMRVSLRQGVAPGPCDIYPTGGTGHGEVEDYTIHIGTGGSAPVAAFGYAQDALTVRFINRSIDPESDITTCQWSFGDGGTSGVCDPTHVFAVGGTYPVSLTMTDAGAHSNTMTMSLTVSPSPPYCESLSQSSPGWFPEWIAQVNLAGTSVSSGAQTYSDFSSQVIDLPAGTHPLTVSIGYELNGWQPWGLHVRAWIDFNGDHDFTDPGEEVFTGFSASTASGSVVVPASATPGLRRMRVSLKYAGAAPAPCGVFERGEVEDYTVNIGG